MSYTKQEFKSGEKLYAAQLNAMDEQIGKNEEDIKLLSEKNNEKADSTFENVPLNGISLTKIEGVTGDKISTETETSINIINLEAMTTGIVAENGIFKPTSGAKHTDYIDVEPGDVLRFVNWAEDDVNNTVRQYPGVLYDNSENYIDRIALWKLTPEVITVDGVDTAAYSYTVPDGAYKLKFNVRDDFLGAVMVTINNPIPSVYVPYHPGGVETGYTYDMDENVLRIRRAVQIPFTGFCQISYSQVWAYAPINTVPTYETAGFLGYDAIKGDVRISADGVLIMCHDDGYTFDDLGKITTYSATNRTLIRNMQSADILALEHAVYNMRVHPCTIDDYLRVCAKWNKIPFVTLRDEYIDEIAPLVLSALKRWNLHHKAIINSFTLETLITVRKIDRYVWVNQVMQRALVDNDINNAKDLYPCMLSPYKGDAAIDVLQTEYDAMSKLVETCKRSGIPVLTAGGYTREQCVFYESHYNGAQMQYITDFAPKKRYFICVERAEGKWSFARHASFEQTGTITDNVSNIDITCDQIVSTWLRYLYPTVTAKCISDGSITVNTVVQANGNYITITPSTVVDGQKILVIVDF